MCNLIKHSGQGCEIQAVVDLYRKSKYPQYVIIKITRKMRDEGASDEEIIKVLELQDKAKFKMDKNYLRNLFGFITSRRTNQKMRGMINDCRIITGRLEIEMLNQKQLKF